MPAIQSEATTLGVTAPAFELPISNPWIDDEGIESDHRALSDYVDRLAVVVIFMCNHCPYVVHVQPELIRLATDYADRGVQVVGINSNDPVRYPTDSFERMADDARRLGYPFPYLFDATQDVARAYGAVCTPDCFVFDDRRRLVYRGRLDGTRPGGAPSDGAEIRAALDAMLEGREVPVEQHPSIGCGIKWRRSA